LPDSYNTFFKAKLSAKNKTKRETWQP